MTIISPVEEEIFAKTETSRMCRDTPPPRPSVKIGFFGRGGVGRYTGLETSSLGNIPDRESKMLTSCAVSPSFISIYNIRRIRKYLDQKSFLTLVHAFITS